MDKAWLRIIGDVHGKMLPYFSLAEEAEHTLQVGDLNLHYLDLQDDELDPTKHKVCGGNHDNYTTGDCSCNGKGCEKCHGRGYIFTEQTANFLGDFGIWKIPEFTPIFYCRGAWSIDWQGRTPGISWWENEEVSYYRLGEAIELYEAMKPDFVVTHTAPKSIIPSVPFRRIFGNQIHGTRTESALQQMFEIHQPKKWIFGHWHVDWVEKINGTQFICLNELSYIDFAKNDPWKDYFQIHRFGMGNKVNWR